MSETSPESVIDLLEKVTKGFYEGWLSNISLQEFPLTDFSKAMKIAARGETTHKAVFNVKESIAKLMIATNINNNVLSVNRSNSDESLSFVAVSLKQSCIHRNNGAYIVTGGLGGLVIAMSRTLALQGAENIVLVSRSAVGPKLSKKQLHELELITTLGARALVRSCDVSDALAVKALVSEVKDTLGLCLRGVFLRLDRSPTSHGSSKAELLSSRFVLGLLHDSILR